MQSFRRTSATNKIDIFKLFLEKKVFFKKIFFESIHSIITIIIPSALFRGFCAWDFPIEFRQPRGMYLLAFVSLEWKKGKLCVCKCVFFLRSLKKETQERSLSGRRKKNKKKTWSNQTDRKEKKATKRIHRKEEAGEQREKRKRNERDIFKILWICVRCLHSLTKLKQ